MKTLVTEQAFKFGQKNIIPFAGEVSISLTGTIEVEDDIAQSVVDADCGFSFQDVIVDETTTTTTAAPTTTTTTIVEEATTTTTIDEINTKPKQDLGNDDLGDLGAGPTGDVIGDQIIDTTTTTTTNISINEAKDELNKQTLAQLKELAKDFPSAEWRALSKEKLVDYIVSKL